MRRTLAAFASLALAAGTIALATPAQSAPVTPNCTTNSLTALTGDSQTFSITLAGGCADVMWGNPDALSLSDIVVAVNGTPFNPNTYPAGGLSSNDTVTMVYSGTATGELTISFEDNGGNNVASFDVRVGGGGSNSGSSDTSGSAPAPVMQQFGLPASGKCEDGYSDSMNWSGVGNGGWGISWAQWVNGGTGGAVCTRTVMYDTSTAKWTVN